MIKTNVKTFSKYVVKYDTSIFPIVYLIVSWGQLLHVQ